MNNADLIIQTLKSNLEEKENEARLIEADLMLLRREIEDLKDELRKALNGGIR